MSIFALPNDKACERKGTKPLRKLAYAGAVLGAVFIVVALLLLAFSGAILNRYGKAKVEHAFARAHPELALRIGKLDYSLGDNRLIGRNVTLTATNASFNADRISLTGVKWTPLFWGSPDPAHVLSKASLDATNIDFIFSDARYELRCARFRASAPNSELIAEGTELRPASGDKAFFAVNSNRTTRLHIIVPEFRVFGLDYGELLLGKSYRAKTISFVEPLFDALVNCDKPAEPYYASPLMVHELLAAVQLPFRIEQIIVTNGSLRYCERVVEGASPGVLTFAAVNLLAEGVENSGAASAAIQIRAESRFMNAGLLKVQMSIPVKPNGFSFHYSGSLGAMDLTRLDEFINIAEHLSIKSGHVNKTEFNIDVTDGVARGELRADYRDLAIAVLDKNTGSAKGLENRIVSFLANVLKIRNGNAPNGWTAMKEGKVYYSRKPDEEFLQFAWFAVRSGIQDVISH